jgi:SAM-dependent methyltransferase
MAPFRFPPWRAPRARAGYWESRARTPIEIYDLPETWAARGWTVASVEEATLSELLAAEEVNSLVVVGSGTGRQCAYLSALGIELWGFDLSPILVAECQTRYPAISTVLADVVHAAGITPPAVAGVSSAVLQHVPPDLIQGAVASLKRISRRLIVIRELPISTQQATTNGAHDYDELFVEWEPVLRITTNEREDVRVELIAWRRRADGSAHPPDPEATREGSLALLGSRSACERARVDLSR